MVYFVALSILTVISAEQCKSSQLPWASWGFRCNEDKTFVRMSVVFPVILSKWQDFCFRLKAALEILDQRWNDLATDTDLKHKGSVKPKPICFHFQNKSKIPAKIQNMNKTMLRQDREASRQLQFVFVAKASLFGQFDSLQQKSFADIHICYVNIVRNKGVVPAPRWKLFGRGRGRGLWCSSRWRQCEAAVSQREHKTRIFFPDTSFHTHCSLLLLDPTSETKGFEKNGICGPSFLISNERIPFRQRRTRKFVLSQAKKHLHVRVTVHKSHWRQGRPALVVQEATQKCPFQPSARRFHDEGQHRWIAFCTMLHFGSPYLLFKMKQNRHSAAVLTVKSCKQEARASAVLLRETSKHQNLINRNMCSKIYCAQMSHLFILHKYFSTRKPFSLMQCQTSQIEICKTEKQKACLIVSLKNNPPTWQHLCLFHFLSLSENTRRNGNRIHELAPEWVLQSCHLANSFTPKDLRFQHEDDLFTNSSTRNNKWWLWSTYVTSKTVWLGWSCIWLGFRSHYRMVVSSDVTIARPFSIKP